MLRLFLNSFNSSYFASVKEKARSLALIEWAMVSSHLWVEV